MDRITVSEVTTHLGRNPNEKGRYCCPYCKEFRLEVKEGRRAPIVKCWTPDCPKGAAWEAIRKALRPETTVRQAEAKDFEETALSADSDPSVEKSSRENETWPGLTLAEFSTQKCLPASLLELFGVHEAIYRSDKHTNGGAIPSVRFPYGYWKDGEWRLTAVKVRGGSSHQTFWDKKTPDKEYVPVPFGHYHPNNFADCRDLVICEGESDAITLTISGFPAIGISGAQAWHDSFSDLPPVTKADAVFIICEPGRAGSNFADAIVAGLQDTKREIWVIPFPEDCKDPSELYVQCMKEVGGDGSVQYPERPAGYTDAQFGEYIGNLVTLGAWDFNAGKSLFTLKLEALFKAHAQRYFRSTDTGNAERLVAAFGQNFRYLKDEGIFVVWNGCKWKRDRSQASSGDELFPLTKTVVREKPFWTDRKWKESSESQGKRRAMVTTVTGEDEVRAENRDFDKKPMLLYAANGVVDLQKGKFGDFCREDYVTRSAAVSYEAAARCPKFIEFLNLIFQGDSDTIRFIQKALGYTLSGSTGEQCFFICYGLGANGKSTLLELMAEIIGPDFYTPAKFSTFVTSKHGDAKYEIANLRGMRLVTAVEPRKAGSLDEEVLKQVTGGDMIKSRQIYERPLDYYPEFKLWFAMNNKPNIRGTDDGIWRRVRFIPFNARIPEERRVREFHKLLFNEEGPGILNWLIDGCLAWQREGLAMSGAVKKATEEFRVEQNAFQRFIERCCVEGNGLDEKAGDLYKRYKEDCEANDEFPLRQNEFAEELQRRGYTKHRAHEGFRWRGVALKGTQNAVPVDGPGR